MPIVSICLFEKLRGVAEFAAHPIRADEQEYSFYLFISQVNSFLNGSGHLHIRAIKLPLTFHGRKGLPVVKIGSLGYTVQTKCWHRVCHSISKLQYLILRSPSLGRLKGPSPDQRSSPSGHLHSSHSPLPDCLPGPKSFIWYSSPWAYVPRRQLTTELKALLLERWIAQYENLDCRKV